MGVVVSGVGEASGSPDIVELEVGVSVVADSVASATSTAAERAGAVLAVLGSAGVAEADLATSQYTIDPEYDYTDAAQRLAGYRVSNLVEARIRDITATGRIIDQVAAAGGDHVRVGRLHFSLEDGAALEARARQVAWEDALAKARQLAELSGQTLGSATRITETVGGPPVPNRMMAVAMDSAEAHHTPVQPGARTVTVTLQVEFALQA